MACVEAGDAESDFERVSDLSEGASDSVDALETGLQFGLSEKSGSFSLLGV